MVRELLSGFLDKPLPWMDHKDLERKRGFLGHLAMCYDYLVPFIKAFHLTIDYWRTHRPDSGWKMGDKAWDTYLEVKFAEGRMSEAEEMRGDAVAPKRVRAVPRSKLDLEAVSLFFSPELAPEMTDRVSRVLYAMYGFGDVSGTGFGSSIQTALGLSYRIGVWRGNEGNETSNY